MNTIHRIEEFRPLKIDSPLESHRSIALTIGNFDGFHLGHQKLLSKLMEKAEHSVVLTFTSHPNTVLQNRPVSYLTSLPHRLTLLENFGIDTVIALPFTQEFSEQSPEAFLTFLKSYIPFSHLILGYDAVIGHQRSGHPALLQTLSEKLDFSLEYLEPVNFNGNVVSSRQIRNLIQEGDFKTAELYLGRPYSIYSAVIQGAGKGGRIGFRTANLSVEHLSLPPIGVYAVKVCIENQSYLGVANLGYAPTLHQDRPPVLEVHILDYDNTLTHVPLEVIFLKHLRGEKKFPSIEALKTQIQKDIYQTRSLYNHVDSSLSSI